MPQEFFARKAQSAARSVSERVRLEHRRLQAAGLAILAIAVLAFSLWRAGLAAVFPLGWWRLW